jgi:pilus assembly protein Flp/PilA
MVRILNFAAFTAGWVTARLNIKSERGATAVEYGIMVSLIAAVIVGAVLLLGQKTNTSFQDACKGVNNGAAC